MTEQSSVPSALLELVGEDEQLRYTQRKRLALVEKLTGDGQGVPDDPKAQNIMLAALADMDKQTLGLKKIGSKEKISAADREAAALLARMYGKVGGQDLLASDAPRSEAMPTLDDAQLPPLELVPGETEIGTVSEDYDSFITRMEQSGRI